MGTPIEFGFKLSPQFVVSHLVNLLVEIKDFGVHVGIVWCGVKIAIIIEISKPLYTNV